MQGSQSDESGVGLKVVSQRSHSDEGMSRIEKPKGLDLSDELKEVLRW